MEVNNVKTVEIINFIGRKKSRLKAYQHCLKNKNSFYDWLIFYGIDEFISFFKRL